MLMALLTCVEYLAYLGYLAVIAADSFFSSARSCAFVGGGAGLGAVSLADGFGDAPLSAGGTGAPLADGAGTVAGAGVTALTDDAAQMTAASAAKTTAIATERAMAPIEWRLV
ncbi:unnamed protein product [Closterium sp. NIES-53]